MFIHDCKDYNQSLQYLQGFNDNKECLPEVIKIMSDELIIPYFKNFTLFLRDLNVPKTNKYTKTYLIKPIRIY